MKKYLIVVCGSLFSFNIFAEVQLYGQMHTSINAIEENGKRSTSLTSNESYIGIKGEFDLGGGVKAIFQTEADTAIDALNPDKNTVYAPDKKALLPQ